ncbi:MAG: o-succinylbenzoate synthase [Acidimicrobiia bacterium]
MAAIGSAAMRNDRGFNNGTFEGFEEFLSGNHSRFVSVEVLKLDVPMVRPQEAAHGTQPIRQSILLRIRDVAGRIGIGECMALAAPTYTSEWRDGAWAVLNQWLVPQLLEHQVLPNQNVTGHPMALAAIEMALADLYTQTHAVSVAKLVGSSTRSIVPRAVVGVGVGQADRAQNERIDDLVDEIALRRDRGYRAVKIKISPQWSTRPLAALRSVWPSLDLAVDANGSFSNHAADLLELEEYSLSYIEQPFKAHQIKLHGLWQTRLETMLALDESISSPEMLQLVIELGIGGLINIKPARLGGLVPTMDANHLLGEFGVDGFCGGMYELGLGRRLALAVAGLANLAGRPSDLSPTEEYLENDIAPQLVLGADGTVAIPDSIGLSSNLLDDAIINFTIEQAVFQARS